MSAFLLRFQESANLCAGGDKLSLRVAEVNGGSADSHSTNITGTQTLTEVRQEAADIDRANSGFFVLPT